MAEEIEIDGYSTLFQQVYGTIQKHRAAAIASLHRELVAMYWEIGEYIVKYLQENKSRAAYGEAVLQKLAQDLQHLGERGFSAVNFKSMRLFYLRYPDRKLLRREIRWSHYQCLMRLDCENSRRFYEEMIVRENWSVRELERQIHTTLYERTLSSQGKEQAILIEARKSYLPLPVPDLEDCIKDPYMVDFLQLKDQHYLEKDLENAIISDLEKFLLELGCGFTFAWRQKRIAIGNQFYYVDLAFFHRGLKCLVLIDLKIGKFSHNDAGQMNMYLNYFRENERYEGEHEPIGIILCADKDEETVRYALGNVSQRIFVSRYQTSLPPRELLQKRLNAQKQLYLQEQAVHEKIASSMHPRKNQIFNCCRQFLKITVSSYQKFAGVSHATAQRDLAQAFKEGWLERCGKTRSAYYRLKG